MSLRYLLSVALLIIAGTVLALELSSEPAAAERTYVGQESCMTSGCHADAYGPGSDYQGAEHFRQTMHQKIHLRPTPETVIIDEWFEKDTVLRTYDHRIKVPGKDSFLVELSKEGGEYFAQMRFSGGGDSTEKMKIAYTYGGNGWIQRFLVEIDGSFYVLPFQFVLPGYKQRTTQGGSVVFLDDWRWFVIDNTTFEGRFLKWGTNEFLGKSWDNGCVQCHVNGFGLKKTITGSDTAWFSIWPGKEEGDSAMTDQNILVGCESCHGPGSEHVANPTADNIVAPGKFGNTRQATDLKLDLCNQCHNRFKSTLGLHGYAYDDSLDQPYIPGGDRPLSDFWRSEFGHMSVWPDGLTSKAHHQQGQDYMRSKAYAGHVFKNGCWSCHNVHREGPDGLPYQLNRNWYAMEEDQGCLTSGCHEYAEFGDTVLSPIVGRVVNKHTLHSQEVSQCVNCHFTKTMTIAFTQLPTKPLYEFASHDFKVRRPDLTRKYRNIADVGMLNTCAESCHRNGRGNRNFFDSMPAAPDYGINDAILTYWKEPSDIALADSLWFHYKRLWPQFVGAVKESGARGSSAQFETVFPNPFKSTTSIRFSLPAAAAIDLRVYDMQGRAVRLLAAGRHEGGTYSESWDGTDEFGGVMPAGTYIVRLDAGGRTVTQKVVLQR